jgi:hypothetical protein
MTVSLHAPSLSLMLALGAAACILPDLSLDGLQCPCAEGFTCDTATNTCVTGEGGSTSTAPPDSTSTGPSMGGSSSDGGAPPGPGGASPVGGAGGAIGDGGFGTGGEATGGSTPGGTCDDPIDIPDPGGVLATTVGQGNDMAGNCVDGTGPDVVYTVTSAHTGVLDLTLFSAAELHLHVRTVCTDSASEVACVDKGGVNAFEMVSVAVTQGQIVYVVVDGHGGEESDFSLDVASHP